MQRSFYHLPIGKLKELVYSGEMIDAAEALRLGLIEKITPLGKVMEVSLELAARIMGKGPLGIVAAKKVMNRTRNIPLNYGLELESDLWANLTATEDMKEGARAFIDKRKPQYKCQ